MRHPVEFITTGDGGRQPTKSHEGDAGYDLYVSEDTYIEPHSFRDIQTSLKIAMPPGVWGRIVGRSSTVRRKGLMVVEGVIDQGYRGELFFGVFNLSAQTVPIAAGERLAQLILHLVVETEWEKVNELAPSDRGERGFGSTGV